MPTLPPAMILLLRPFAPLFAKRVWLHVQVLLAGAILVDVGHPRMSGEDTEMVKIPRALVERFTETLCSVA